MLHHIRPKLKPIARGLTVLLAALGLMAGTAPCVLAQPHPLGVPAIDRAVPTTQVGMHACATIGCRLKDLASPLNSVTADLAVTLVLLTILPAPIALPSPAPAHNRELFTPEIRTPPLPIRYFALLI